MENGRLKLNEFLQSVSNPAVYAAGDAAQKGPPLTPVSSHDAKVVAANLVEGNHARPDYRGVPSVVFTLPPIAAVGMSEEEARTSGRKFRTQSKRASRWFTARQAAESVYEGLRSVRFGNQGAIGGGCAGIEVDRCDVLLGADPAGPLLPVSQPLDTTPGREDDTLRFA